jgi:hypothetical protein
MLWTLLGIACVLYTAAELARILGQPAAAPHSAARFGAVDASTGQPLDVTFDRRIRGRRTSDR